MNDDDAAPLFARLLCDIMVPAELSEAIRLQGYDVLEARQLPLEIQQDDWTILGEAARQRRAVVTCNYSDPPATFALFTRSGGSRAKNTQVSSSFRNFKSAIVCGGGKFVTACSIS